jgi:Flp pilus assembly pilin Flp
VDFYVRFRGSEGAASDLLVSRIFTVLWGGFACFVALRAGGWHASAIELVNRLGSLFYGSILGVFLLAVLAPRARAAGAFYGLILGIGAVSLVAAFTSIHFLWWNLIGTAVVFAAGSLISALSPREAPLPR